MTRLTLQQIAAEYGKCAKTFRKYVRELEIPHIRLGRDMLFDPARVEAHLEQVTRSKIEPVADLKAKSVQKSPVRKSPPETAKYAAMLGL